MIALRRLAPMMFLALAVAPPSSAVAAEISPFTPAAFDAAKASGKSILLDVSAPWCPTCKAQHPILAGLEAEPKFKDLVVLNVDFDSQKDVLRSLGVRMQSTLIAFKGSRETARSTGDTRPGSIAHLLDAAL